MDLADQSLAARREAQLGPIARLHLGEELGLVAFVEPLPGVRVRGDLPAGHRRRVVLPPAGRRVGAEPGDEPFVPPGAPVALEDRGDPVAVPGEEARAVGSGTAPGRFAAGEVGRGRAQLGSGRLLRPAQARGQWVEGGTSGVR